MHSIFSDQQVITASAVSTNTYDLGAPGRTAYNSVQLRRNIGICEEPLLIQVTETFNTLTSLVVEIQTDDNVAFTSPKVVLSVTVPLANLIEGYISPIDNLPRGVKERYLRLNYTVVGANPTLGKITAGFVGAVDGAYRGNV